MFSAPAIEVERWAGIPQKKRLGESETTGFQRELDDSRLVSLSKFYSDPKNVIQNPLLLALRKSVYGSVRFEPNSEDSDLGEVVVTLAHDPSERTLFELLRDLKDQLEIRVPELSEREVPQELLTRLAAVAANAGHEQLREALESSEEEEVEEADFSSAVTDESHILDFWDDVAGRLELLERLGSGAPPDEFLGYTTDALQGHLKPAVVVDGQHRLQGAVAVARDLVSTDAGWQERQTELIDQGNSPSIARGIVEGEACRVLPISMLMDNEPSEHVFQFVIVNQKATPMGKPLLGTIISTTLSNAERELVGERLESAGIKLDDSRAATSLIRDPESPFYRLVERGMAGDKADVLGWSVFLKLVKIFRDLKGGTLFHQKNDYADKWQRQLLSVGEITAEYTNLGFPSEFQYWRTLNGPWRAVFIKFWLAIRDWFSDCSDSSADNYWGAPRRSNLFNKVSLTILAADFFQYLCDTEQALNGAEEIDDIVEKWLTGVSRQYFARDWRLSSVKKDMVGIRKQWANLWVEYRKDPQRMPRVESYSVKFG